MEISKRRYSEIRWRKFVEFSFSSFVFSGNMCVLFVDVAENFPYVLHETLTRPSRQMCQGNIDISQQLTSTQTMGITACSILFFC
jgi:hypothetical protein